MLFEISIHALLAESDSRSAKATDWQVISIHALLAESDTNQTNNRNLPRRFLSTLSLRRATLTNYQITVISDDFYPRSPCGERPVITKPLRQILMISIHALLAESDANPKT